jgi:hypothetical protein
LTSEADVIHINKGNGHTIINNVLISNKLDASAHPDLLQFGNYGGTSGNRMVTTIAGNLMLGLNTTSPMLAGMNSDNTQPTRWLIYNNIIALRGVGNTGLVLYDAYDESSYNGKSSAFIFNNTIINDHGYTLKIGNVDTLVMKNNIYCKDNTDNNETVWFTNAPRGGNGFTSITYKDIDYNLYYNQHDNDAKIDTGDVSGNENSNLTLAQWQAKGYDLQGSKISPTFANLWGYHIADYMLLSGSAGIDAGTNLSTYFTTDILGMARPQGAAYDMGAFQHINASAPTPVELTTFSGIFINNSVRLTWSTATEINNQGFDIERNTNSSWVKIGFIEGKGNSVIKNDYSFEDKTPVGSKIQYRLKQIDYNGNFKYYDAISVTAIPQDFSIGNYLSKSESIPPSGSKGFPHL